MAFLTGIVQCIDAIVDPNAAGVPANYDWGVAESYDENGNIVSHPIPQQDSADGMPDPSSPGPPSSWSTSPNTPSRNPGRFVRIGGTGFMQFKNKKNGQPPAPPGVLDLSCTANDRDTSIGIDITIDGTEFGIAPGYLEPGDTADIADIVVIGRTVAPDEPSPADYEIQISNLRGTIQGGPLVALSTKYTIDYFSGNLHVGGGG